MNENFMNVADFDPAFSLSEKTNEASREEAGSSLSKKRNNQTVNKRSRSKTDIPVKTKIKNEKSAISRKIGPSLTKGMTYKSLYDKYKHEGNMELERIIQNLNDV
jgi:hypothetical protein